MILSLLSVCNNFHLASSRYPGPVFSPIPASQLLHQQEGETVDIHTSHSIHQSQFFAQLGQVQTNLVRVARELTNISNPSNSLGKICGKLVKREKWESFPHNKKILTVRVESTEGSQASEAGHSDIRRGNHLSYLTQSSK